ncbi:hypothetical protein A3860_08095 [Niastella vici]|uniref:Histidine kinase domain-containing protein n=1 Tax=Niastella vici TaxID=1703345 RepID=A0A1V9FIV4_9BACT|nr:sensor histidine kinase [Niastella vici]OQP58270.1 hypothetical protein A3860_08095 [Niastella vici]
MRLVLFYKITILIILFSFLESNAQQISFLPLTKLNRKDLLPSLNARKIVKDNLGFIWVATQDGLYRFDGRHSVYFTHNEKDPRFALGGTDIFDLAITEDGRFLWALSNNGTITRINILQGIVDRTVTLTAAAIWAKSLCTAGNYLYAGTAEGLVYRIDNRNGAVSPPLSLGKVLGHGGSVDNIIAGPDQQIYLLVSGLGIIITDQDLRHIRTLNPDQFFPGSKVEFFDYVIYNHSVIISSNAGLLVLNMPANQLKPAAQVMPPQARKMLPKKIDCMTVSGDIAYFAGDQHLIEVNLQSGNYRQIIFSRNMEDQDWLIFTSSLYFDGVSLWIGSQYGTGWIKDVHTPFTAFYTSKNTPSEKLEHCMTLFHTDTATIYACTDHGLYKLQTHTGNLQRVSERKQYYAGIDVKGRGIIASGPHGTEAFDHNGNKAALQRMFPELTILKNETLVAMETIRDSLYFFSGFNPTSLFCWDRVRRQIHRLPSSGMGGSRKGYFVKKLYASTKGKLWILFDASISIYDPANGNVQELTLYPPGETSALSILMDVCESSNRYWITVYGKGIAQLIQNGKIEQLYSIAEGVHNLCLYSVLPLNDSIIIASSNEGLTSVNLHTRQVRNFFEEDGLHSNYFEQFSSDQQSNHIFFGGLKGLTMIDRKKFHIDNGNSHLYAKSVSLQNSSGSLDTFSTLFNQMIVPSTTIQVAFNFCSVNFSTPEKETFFYRITEVDSSWIPIGHQNSISLIGLSPGAYTVQVKSSESNKTAGMHPLQLKLIWLPHWYQTWWFKAAILLLIIVLTYLVFSYRIYQMKKEQQIRKGIASDLHDDIGSTLNALKVYSHLARREPGKEEHMIQIEESLAQASSGLRDMLWTLDDNNDTMSGIMERIKKFAMPLAIANNIELQYAVNDEQNQPVSKTEKRNLLMIAKESINNAIKYAQPKTILIRLEYRNNLKSLIISDDGKGFSINMSGEGNGLKNIRYRAAQIHFETMITSTPGKGTAIKVWKK